MREQGMSLTRSGQGGIITLMVVVILLMVATIATFTAARAGWFEQKFAGLDVRGKEVHAAAIGGLEFGVQWLWHQWPQLTWSEGSEGDRAIPEELNDSLSAMEAGADQYRTDVAYELVTPLPEVAEGSLPLVIKVLARATAEADSHVTKTVSAEVMLGRVGLFHGGDLLDAPPVVVENCITGVTGDITLFPHNGIAIGTTEGNVVCISDSGFDFQGGVPVMLDDPRTLSQAIFGLPEEILENALREIEQREPERVLVIDLDDDNNPDRSRNYLFSGGRDGEWRSSLDDITLEPYLLYFTAEAGCPRLRDGVVIHGLVYYAAPDCALHDWGDAHIVGTVALAGSVMALTGSAVVHGRTWDFRQQWEGSTSPQRFEPGVALVEVLQVPGSWRDF